MDGNPATVWFVFFVNGREDTRKREKEKLHSLKGDEDTLHGNRAAKNLNTGSKALYSAGGTRGEIVCKFVFFKTSQRGNISRNCSYLYIHSLLFQSMKNKWKSQVKGGVDFILLSLSTSPRPTPPFDALPQLLDSRLPLNPACFGQSSRVGRVEPACRYCSSFHFSIMSLVADVHMCCPCVYPERWTLFWFCCLSIFSFKFGLSSENRAMVLVYERKPHIVLIVWSVVSILMRWNPSCRIFCIARIVRQWEDRGAIWREFSYWMEPQQQPIGCHII